MTIGAAVRPAGAVNVGVAALILVVLVAVSASAQTAADDIRARVREGQKVLISNDQGDELTGRVGILSATTLTLLSRGVTTNVPYASITRIDRPRDTLRNGALIGLGVGAALWIAVLAAEQRCDPTRELFCGDPGVGAIVGGTAFVGGLGAAAGVGVDALIRRNRSIYRRGGRITLSPELGRGAGGATLSVRW